MPALPPPELEEELEDEELEDDELELLDEELELDDELLEEELLDDELELPGVVSSTGAPHAVKVAAITLVQISLANGV